MFNALQSTADRHADARRIETTWNRIRRRLTRPVAVALRVAVLLIVLVVAGLLVAALPALAQLVLGFAVAVAALVVLPVAAIQTAVSLVE